MRLQAIRDSKFAMTTLYGSGKKVIVMMNVEKCTHTPLQNINTPNKKYTFKKE